MKFSFCSKSVHKCLSAPWASHNTPYLVKKVYCDWSLTADVLEIFLGCGFEDGLFQRAKLASLQEHSFFSALVCSTEAWLVQAIALHLLVDIRVVTKISSCRVNTTSRRGIKRLGISFGSIFVLFSNKSSRGHSLSSRGKSPAPDS